MVRLIFFDAEGKGPCASKNNHADYEWGAVDFSSWLQYANSGDWKPGMQPEINTFHGRGANAVNIEAFRDWVRDCGENGDQFVMVTDNPAYDWQHMNYYMHHFLHSNIFGHSARRIGDFALGIEAHKRIEGALTAAPHGLASNVIMEKMMSGFLSPQRWKKLRITPHSHHPVEDALGNVEAFAQLLGWRPPTQRKLL
jgi:hypothetical protein